MKDNKCPECGTNLQIEIDNGIEVRFCDNCSFCETNKLDKEEKIEEGIQQFDLFGNKTKKVIKLKKLEDKYLVPPFSYFDTKQGYWQKRKRMWNNYLGFTGQGLEEGLISKSDLMLSIGGGRSLFDPVLAEIIIKWFCPDYGKVLDPFAGEAIKGLIAEKLKHKYYAIEIRKDQIKENTKLGNKLGLKPTYVNGDSNDIYSLLKEYGKFDLCFTSPPYYDLEMYSKRDASSSITYGIFMKTYKNIFKQCYDLLNDNRFLVVKVSEVRNEEGEYYGFVSDNINLFKDIGFKYYNEIILLNVVGTASVRASGYFTHRKVARMHQNILVFYKGKLNNISKIFKKEVQHDIVHK